MEKIRKYVWIGLCTAFIVWHIVSLIAFGHANDVRFMGTMSSVTYILVFLTAIFHELKVNKNLLYIMLALSILVTAYTAIFTKLIV
ncbi:MAG TPA: hypothetical protein DDZ96_06035 [Porphyromonadaceae bacterium]|jgi:hypothetical protein|nr:hypothetical protein [Porphyromonadaceae bacterium]HBL33367.1 hypothetical protein [Porphyromonadaceae bacterium]HBX21520.1 hypothetical protein [Porphyromonadaceae bacterium]HCM19916.1 hypothetical protein [Porphyromonadaceae bacterium]